jgi:8-oxo-dGTP pyrophosphatase MutT (NUDIX family)
MSEQMPSPTRDDQAATMLAADDGGDSPEGAMLPATAGIPGPADQQADDAGKKKKKKAKKTLAERTVYEAGGIIVCDGKVVLRLTDKQHWIFPKGKLKKHESAMDAALREATEETGLRVEVLDEIADLLIHHEGKKRRFVFYLMRATAKTWDWPHHDGRDTFLMAPERVAPLVRHEGYAAVWEAAAARVQALCDDRTPFEAGHPAPPAG